MPSPASPGVSNQMMTVLSSLLLSQPHLARSASDVGISGISEGNFKILLDLSHSNHVIVRGLEAFRTIMVREADPVRASWAQAAIDSERNRIGKAVASLQSICEAFNAESLDVTVMKSLDHWPDLGSDLDLYTNAPPPAVCSLMQRRFGARMASRSWGDRLAYKWNFLIPDLPEPVEIHIGRLGQTGEQLVLASQLPQRARLFEIEGHTFPVPSSSDRLMISTLQRMYRHFYFRLCDMVDSASLVDSGVVDYEELKSSAQAAGIWEGVATYLVVVSDYVRRYRGTELDLPHFVRTAAHFTGATVYFRNNFLRVPILPQSIGLYRKQIAGLLRRRELESSARLGLLPWLAIAAAVGHKLTGSDKGIW
jgi:hypothetical protein